MIIGISGVAGAGKDALADMLVKHGCVKVALADPIKRMVRDTFDFTQEQLWGPSIARNQYDKRYPREHTWGPSSGGWVTCACCGDTRAAVGAAGTRQCYLTPRYALQTLGTEWARNCYPNTWVDHLIRAAQKLAVEGGYVYTAERGLDTYWRPGDPADKLPVVVPDVRFKNEIDALRAAGAYLIRIARPGAGLGGSHSSETEQARIPNGAFDMVVDNTGTLEDLKTHAAQIYEGVIAPPR